LIPSTHASRPRTPWFAPWSAEKLSTRSCETREAVEHEAAGDRDIQTGTLPDHLFWPETIF